MARSDYGPGRRRRPVLAWLLDWAAGILVAILALMLIAWPLSAMGVRGRALLITGGVLWGLGAGLGVWLCMGRRGGGRGGALGAGVGLLAAGLLGLPALLELGPVLAQVGLSAALLLTPACARLALGRTQPSGPREP